ncbi:MAG: hypothetical protein CFE23_14870 [Flavobacterium sp. BFFFF1]|uniref:hypothetical protein n=1 Tax=Flavobacterium sp. BFFFF1 TaxID=2015557 RepID=UPI000BDCCC29|nr:hypothetical protein [Flavobacterium sp. BFFFF1]OYU79267.1 MAG: hypothetical protein CFE23_14870 [Flavobacterium sp. BFFFF1]
MKTIVLTLVALAFFSCTGKNPTVVLHSELPNHLDSVLVYASHSCGHAVFKNIGAGFTGSAVIPFCKALQSDGSYAIQCYSGGTIYAQKGFGYYTNGASLNNGFDITITKEGSIKVDGH